MPVVVRRPLAKMAPTINVTIRSKVRWVYATEKLMKSALATDGIESIADSILTLLPFSAIKSAGVRSRR
jgi:hypothetical protein